MDQREHDVEEDLKNILHTRMALAEKVQSLEQRVRDTVRYTRETAMDTLETVQKQAVQWMASPTGRLGQLGSFAMLARRSSMPSLIAGSVVGIGLLAVWMKQGKRHRRSGVYPYYPPRTQGADVVPAEERSGVYPYYTPRAEGADVMPQGEGSRQRHDESNSIYDRRSTPPRETTRKESGEADSSSLRSQVSEFVNGVKNELTQERTRVQKATLQIARSFARDMVRFAGQSLVALMEQLSAGGQARSRQDQPKGR